jgi:hypothetical protein
VKVFNVHERLLTAAPEDVAAVFGDMSRVWPDPVPAPLDGDLQMGPMLWRRFDRPGSPAAFSMAGPPEFPGEHWFEVGSDGRGGSVLRHTIAAEAIGDFEEVWRDRIEPMHNVYIEALFDKVQAEVS